MANPRLGHKKSRNGCLQCKKRRVKCDEQRPCSNCKRHNADCSLLHGNPQPLNRTGPSRQVAILPNTARSPTNSSNTSQAHSQSPPMQTVVPAPTPLSPNPFAAFNHIVANQPSSWIKDLELLHHYTTATSTTIVRKPQRVQVFQMSLPKLAFEHEFLMHGILALSAMHLAYQRPERSHPYSVMSTYHEQIAIGDFRSALANVTQENCHALVALGSLLAIIPFASIATAHRTSPTNTITPSSIAQSFVLIQGIKNVLHAPNSVGNVRNGPLGPLLSIHLPVPDEELTGPFAAALDALDVLNSSGRIARAPPADHIAVTVAISSLRRTYGTICAEDSVREIAVWMWPSMVPPRFLELIRISQPMALVVLAYFAALSTEFEHSWFLGGWGRAVIEAVMRSLDDEVRMWVQEPYRWVREGVKVLNQTP